MQTPLASIYGDELTQEVKLMKKNQLMAMALAGGSMMGLTAGAVRAADIDDSGSDAVRASCRGLPTYQQLKAQLKAATGTPPSGNGGFNFEMWATVVNRSGRVCAVAYSGKKYTSQWPASRVISAQKAYTATSLSLDGFALSTANLYAPTQPGGSLYGLQHSNPVFPLDAYRGSSDSFGTPNDPMIGHRIGGINVFGGGLALYRRGASGGAKVIGAVGVSGDSSCADHNVAWRLRNLLGLDFVPAGPNSVNTGVANGRTTGDDNIKYQSGGPSPTALDAFEHTECSGTGTEVTIAAGLPAAQIP
jgi:uncharacterized protein GlcG (DUF336 family)